MNGIIINHLEGFSLLIAGLLCLLPAYFLIFKWLPRWGLSLGSWSAIVFSCICTSGMMLFHDDVAKYLLQLLGSP